MADPKSKVQDTIKILQNMVEVLDRDIEIVEKNAIKANKLNDAIALGEQTSAVGRLNNQISQIDDFILNDPDISALIGATEGEGTKGLNEAIRKVTEAVKRVKAWEFKDRKGNAVNIGIKTDDVKTDVVVDEVDKITDIHGDVDYDNVVGNVADMEAKIAQEELYQRYLDTQASLGGTEEVDENYENFIKSFMQKMKEHRALGKLKDFSTDGLVTGKFKFAKNETRVKELLTLLNAAKGKTEITVPGLNGGNPIAIEKLSFEEIAKLNNTVIANTMAALVSEAKVKDSEFEDKTAEMSSILAASQSMQKLFTEDRDRIQAILDAKPLNMAELDLIFDEISKADSKNQELLGDMVTYKSVGDIEGLKRELARLKELAGLVEAENAAKAVKHEAQEFSTIKIGDKEITLQKGSYTGDFVALTKKDDFSKVTEETFSKLDDETYGSLVEAIEEDAISSGNKLPNRLWSGLMSVITFGAYSPRQKAIEARAKAMIKDKIKTNITAAKAKAEGKQELAVADAEKATTEREKMTDFDRSLRVTENDLAREQMRQQIIASRGRVTAENARKGLNLDQINEDARKKLEEDEGR